MRVSIVLCCLFGVALSEVITIDNTFKGNAKTVVNNIVTKTGCGYKKALQQYQREYSSFAIEQSQAQSCARSANSAYASAKRKYESDKQREEQRCRTENAKKASCEADNARCRQQSSFGSSRIGSSFCFTRFCGSSCYPRFIIFTAPRASCFGYKYCNVSGSNGNNHAWCIPPFFTYKKQDLTINIKNTAKGDLTGLINNMISISC